MDSTVVHNNLHNDDSVTKINDDVIPVINSVPDNYVASNDISQ